MKMEIEAVIRHLRAFNVARQEQDILDIVKGYGPQLIDYNLAQLQAGKRADDSDIEPEYSPFTVSMKKALGMPYDRVTLYQEGDFYGGFFAEFDGWPIVIDSKDVKTPKLDEKYGPNLFGLTDESTRQFVAEIKEPIQNYYSGTVFNL